MKLRLLTLSLALIATPVMAHDFWLQPVRFQVAPNAPLGATFLVGHAALRERWSNNDRIIALNDVFTGGRTDRRGDLQGSGEFDLVSRFSAPGIHVLGMQSNYAFSDLPAIRFNDYAKLEGLALVIAARARGGKDNAPGRERYSRRAKSLVQVGAQTAPNQQVATRPIGLKLEIIPDRNPYALGASRMLPVHVRYNGRRLANATVKLTNLGNDAKPVAEVVTNRNGQATFRIPAGGNWLLNVVWSEPVAGDARVDFDTTFSSLTFGYPGAPRVR
ncbi:MAG: DUF4198 domain-containing protein [Pseudomonadota bacterium]|nr:DUF4198 domain-containing protein [Pseudomonadota bacterium]